jgi:hypothetical protein
MKWRGALSVSSLHFAPFFGTWIKISRYVLKNSQHMWVINLSIEPVSSCLSDGRFASDLLHVPFRNCTVYRLVYESIYICLLLGSSSGIETYTVQK